MTTYTGIVQKGTRHGAALGFPTVNIPLSDESISGIYVARVYIQDESPYMAAVYADQGREVLEAHILDFSDQLYGQEIKIELHKKIRDGKKFVDEKEARATIASDVDAVRAYFRK